jgi:hypothetical protein
MATRREVAELLGYRIEEATSPGLLGEVKTWIVVYPDGYNREIGARAVGESKESSWAALLNSDWLPDWPRDPVAAMRLLAGDDLDWSAKRANDEIVLELRQWSRCIGSAPIENDDDPAAFANAATDSWCAWKREEG